MYFGNNERETLKVINCVKNVGYLLRNYCSHHHHLWKYVIINQYLIEEKQFL